jgi:L-threonylcarbamoyladenylate synthase
VAAAAAVLERGGTVAVPTETVYGLAARADRAEAVAGIYRAKGAPISTR